MFTEKYYADYDEETGLYCVFHIDTGKAYSSYAVLSEAEKNTKERNQNDYYLYTLKNYNGGQE